MEAHGTGRDAAYDRVKQTLRQESDRPTALRYAIQACREGGHSLDCRRLWRAD